MKYDIKKNLPNYIFLLALNFGPTAQLILKMIDRISYYENFQLSPELLVVGPTIKFDLS